MCACVSTVTLCVQTLPVSLLLAGPTGKVRAGVDIVYLRGRGRTLLVFALDIMYITHTYTYNKRDLD